MTAITGKYKNKIENKIHKIKKYDAVTLILLAVLGWCAGRSNWCDITLAGLAIVVCGCTQDILCRYATIIGSLVSCGLLAVKDSSFIPYFLGVVLFAVGANFSGKDSCTVAFSAGAMALSKLVLVCYNMSFYYKAFCFLEGVGIYFLTLTAQNGTGALLHNKLLHSFSDIFCGFVALVCGTLALCGADSHWLYPGFAVALGAGWYFVSYGRHISALLSLIRGCVSLVDKRGFAFLLVCGALLWFLSSCFAENMSVFIYPVAIVSAFVANVAFISQVNSLALVSSAVLALMTYTALPLVIKGEFKDKSPVWGQGRDWRLLMLSMKKLEDSLHFLAGSVIDISRLGEKNTKPYRLEDMVAEDVCRNCARNTVCWQEKYSFTYQQFEEYAKKMYWSGENGFSTGFCAQCINVGGVVKSFEENSRLLLSQKYIRQSQKNNQKLLQNAFVSVSQAVGDLIYSNQRSHLLNTTITMETDRFLNQLGAGHTYCLCSQNPDRVTFAVLNPVDDNTLYKIHSHVERQYSARFSPPVVEKQGSEILYIFDAQPLYAYETAIESSRYKNVNGDNREIFTRNGKLYIVLSDGMGTGALAAAESCTVTAMTKSLITTGVTIKTAIDIINLALNLKGSGEKGASVDILETDLFTGKTVITKAGAGTSLVIGKDGLSRYYGDSLPLGILKDVRPVECSFTLKNGETAVIMSDGAGVVSADIRNMHSSTCGRIAQHIASRNTTQDDKTVIALRLKLNTAGKSAEFNNNYV